MALYVLLTTTASATPTPTHHTTHPKQKDEQIIGFIAAAGEYRYSNSIQCNLSTATSFSGRVIYPLTDYGSFFLTVKLPRVHPVPAPTMGTNSWTGRVNE